MSANRRLLGRFLDEVVGEPAVLVGNSMGGAISILQAGTEPATVAGLVMVGPAVPRTLLAPIDPTVAKNFATHAVPLLGGVVMRRRLDRLGPAGVVEETLDLCCVDAERIPQDVKQAGIEMRRERMEMPWAEQSFLDASRSLMATLIRRKSFDACVAAITAPGLIVHGLEDPLVAEANVRRLAGLRPDWQLELLRDVGHVPQLEVPDLFVQILGGWLDRLPDAARAGG